MILYTLQSFADEKFLEDIPIGSYIAGTYRNQFERLMIQATIMAYHMIHKDALFKMRSLTVSDSVLIVFKTAKGDSPKKGTKHKREALIHLNMK